MENMTKTTQKMYDQAIHIHSVQEALNVLENGNFRTLGDVLRSCAGQENPKDMLVEGLLKNHPGSKRDSISRKVRNWLTGRTLSVEKTEGFELAQIMGLTLNQTDEFLRMALGEGIHWRQPEEIVWSYSIQNQMNYSDTCCLLKQLQKTLSAEPKIEDRPGVFTGDIQETLTPLVFCGSEEELLRGIREQQGVMGRFHNTAYDLFMSYFRQLETGKTLQEREQEKEIQAQITKLEELKKHCPGSVDGQAVREKTDQLRKELNREKVMSSKEVLKNYIYYNHIYRELGKEPKQKAAGSSPMVKRKITHKIQKTIAAGWPDEINVSKMKNRRMDITRKALILLFLAADDGGAAHLETEYGEEVDLTRDEMLEEISTRMNQMLHVCGFSGLDARNPFDWMVLYCICEEDIFEIDHKMSQILSAIFPEEEQE